MTEFLETSFFGTSLPASMLLSLVLVYWLFVIFGALDLDLFDFDLDFDADASLESALSLGFVPLRFLNLGRVPLMLWVSIFGLSWWVLSMLLEPIPSPEDWKVMAMLIGRDMGIAVIFAKIATNPLRGKFDPKEPYTAEELIGGTCVVLTSEVTASAGQAEYQTEGAPLKLNVRATDETLAKGDVGEIVDYDPEKHIYLVMKSERET